MTIASVAPISWKFTGKPWDLNSLPLTPDQVWAMLDLPPEEVRTALNVLIGILNSVTDGASGADNVGSTAPAGLTGTTVQALINSIKTYVDANPTYALSTGAGLVGATAPTGLTGSTVQALINALKTAIDNTVLGQIPDGSLTNIKLATDIKVGSLAALTTTDKSSVTAAVNEHLANTTPHGATASSTANAIALRDASGNLTASALVSNVAAGTAPLIVTSPTAVANLNADMVDGLHASSFPILGTLNTDLNKIKALPLKTDTRTTTLTYTSGVLTSVVDADGTTTVKTTTLTYTSGVLTSVAEVAGGTTVTTTLNYTSGVLTSVTKAVV